MNKLKIISVIIDCTRFVWLIFFLIIFFYICTGPSVVQSAGTISISPIISCIVPVGSSFCSVSATVNPEGVPLASSLISLRGGWVRLLYQI